MLFNEPKLLKSITKTYSCASAGVSVLFNEPKLLKLYFWLGYDPFPTVSVLFNEPKLLKWRPIRMHVIGHERFSALQRAEIAEI